MVVISADYYCVTVITIVGALYITTGYYVIVTVIGVIYVLLSNKNEKLILWNQTTSNNI